MDQLDTVLSQLRDEYSPDAGAQNRVRAALGASLATSAIVGAATTKTAAAAGVAGTTGAGAAKGAIAGVPIVWAKLIAGAGVATAVALGGSHLSQRSSQPAQQQPVSAPAVAMAVAASKPNRVASAPQVGPTQDTPMADSTAVEKAQSAAAPEEKRQAPPGAMAHTPRTHSSTMLEEFRLLRQASQELRAGQNSAAQRTLDEHKRRFPKTVLGDERRGLALLVSCASGNTSQNRAAAEGFVQAAPASPLADSIKRRCLQ